MLQHFGKSRLDKTLSKCSDFGETFECVSNGSGGPNGDNLLHNASSHLPVRLHQTT